MAEFLTRALAATAFFLLVGCTTLPSGLTELGWQKGTGFEHLVVANSAFTDRQTPLGRLHLYIGGDGRAWFDRTTVSKDPTSRSLALELMTLDNSPALYLGRPCYHGLSSQAPCEPTLWTHARWGSVVRESMVTALQELLTEHGVRHVSVYGYSGGGVLALLLAREVEAVDRVITIAAPLDIAAWSTHHGFTPLSGSSNPAAFSSWPARLNQWHWQGELDAVVPAATTARFRSASPSATFVPVKLADHSCCWEKHWPTVLDVTSRAKE